MRYPYSYVLKLHLLFCPTSFKRLTLNSDFESTRRYLFYVIRSSDMFTSESSNVLIRTSLLFHSAPKLTYQVKCYRLPDRQARSHHDTTTERKHLPQTPPPLLTLALANVSASRIIKTEKLCVFKTSMRGCQSIYSHSAF